MRTFSKPKMWVPLLFCGLLLASCTSKQEETPPQQLTCDSGRWLQPDSIVYGLNLLSNAMFNVDTTYDLLQSFADSAIHQVLRDTAVQARMGRWSVAWGPVVFSNAKDNCGDDCVVDNLLVLYKRQCTMPGVPEYVLATSGTNGNSKFGWFDEDFDVYQMVQWPNKASYPTIEAFTAQLNSSGSTSSTGIAVSVGTATGVVRLLNMSDGNQGTLYQTLKDSIPANSNATLAVAGHSLGGALSPALALALKQYQKQWNDLEGVTVTTHPTAGASPGNLAFRDYFYQTIGAQNFRGRMNLNDLVPHAWQPSFLAKIKELYADKQGIKNVPMIDSLMSKVQRKLLRTYGQNPYASLYCKQDSCIPDSTTTYSFTQPYSELLHTVKLIPPKDYIHFCCQYDVKKGLDSLDLYRCDLIHTNRDVYSKLQTELGCANSDTCSHIGISLLYVMQVGYQHTTAYSKQFDVQIIMDQMRAAKKRLGILDTKTPPEQQEELLQALLNYINALN